MIIDDVSLQTIELAVSEDMRPRVSRKLGLELKWDLAIDSLPKPQLNRLSGWCALSCIAYRNIRPKIIGDRCAFEPSCSRYSELCFRLFGIRKAIKLTILRLHKCGPKCGGIDLPPTIFLDSILLKEVLK